MRCAHDIASLKYEPPVPSVLHFLALLGELNILIDLFPPLGDMWLLLGRGHAW